MKGFSFWTCLASLKYALMIKINLYSKPFHGTVEQ